MLTALAVSNYRSLRDLVLPLKPVNVITGPNGSGKSSLYRALRLLASTARDGVVNALAEEGGLDSTIWAGPEQFSRAMREGTAPVQGTRRSGPVRLRLGFSSEEFSYAISLGFPPSDVATQFNRDPQIKHECVWAGPKYRPAAVLIERKNAAIRARHGKEWRVVGNGISPYESLFAQVADIDATPEAFRLRESIRGWRFYDHFRTDSQAPARQPQLGTRTPVLSHDGHDLAAAVQTIREIGDRDLLDRAVDDAFPGATLDVVATDDGRFSLHFQQEGLLRPLNTAELSDGTLRYLLWIAALLTPRPPALMVLNEPETSLHPDLLPALARLVVAASKRSQVWIVSHAPRLINALEAHEDCNSLRLEKELGETRVPGLPSLELPPWEWPD